MFLEELLLDIYENFLKSSETKFNNKIAAPTFIAIMLKNKNLFVYYFQVGSNEIRVFVESYKVLLFLCPHIALFARYGQAVRK